MKHFLLILFIIISASLYGNPCETKRSIDDYLVYHNLDSLISDYRSCGNPGSDSELIEQARKDWQLSLRGTVHNSEFSLKSSLDPEVIAVSDAEVRIYGFGHVKTKKISTVSLSYSLFKCLVIRLVMDFKKCLMLEDVGQYSNYTHFFQTAMREEVQLQTREKSHSVLAEQNLATGMFPNDIIGDVTEVNDHRLLSPEKHSLSFSLLARVMASFVFYAGETSTIDFFKKVDDSRFTIQIDSESTLTYSTLLSIEYFSLPLYIRRGLESNLLPPHLQAELDLKAERTSTQRSLYMAGSILGSIRKNKLKSIAFFCGDAHTAEIILFLQNEQYHSSEFFRLGYEEVMKSKALLANTPMPSLLNKGGSIPSLEPQS